MNDKQYEELTDRNLGFISKEQQELLRNSCFAVFGLGGLGGVISEILARTGIGHLKIIDYDKFDPTNLNRQVYCFRDTIGRMKTDVTEEFLKRINPGLKIEKFTEVNTKNINEILQGVTIGLLAIDNLKPCLIISRACRQLDIPLVEGWALPYANVRVFTKDTPTLEETYQMPTIGRDISDGIPEEEYEALKLHMMTTLKKVEGIEKYYSPLAIERIMKNTIPSFAPVVWLNGAIMSLEAIKVLLKWGKISLSPHFSLYNPFYNTIPKQEL